MSNDTNSSDVVVKYAIAHPGIQFLAAVLCIVASSITMHQIYKHLYYYTSERHQRHIIRLLLIIPAYSIYAFTSLMLVVHAKVLCYEYIGGEGRIMVELDGQTIPFSIFYGTCCFAGRPYTILFFRFCKIATLQYTLIKPFTSIITLVLVIRGNYVQGDFDPSSGYLWMFLINNLTVSLALYGLLLFYFATRSMLSAYKPLLKFATIKAIIFFSFWQSVLFTILELSGVIKAQDGYSASLISEGYKNFLISMELVGVAIVLRYAFPYQIYMTNKKETDAPNPFSFASFDNNDFRQEPPKPVGFLDRIAKSFPFTKRSDTEEAKPELVFAHDRPANMIPEVDSSAADGGARSISASIGSTMNPRDVFQDAIHNLHPAYRHYTQYDQKQDEY